MKTTVQKPCPLLPLDLWGQNKNFWEEYTPSIYVCKGHITIFKTQSESFQPLRIRIFARPCHLSGSTKRKNKSDENCRQLGERI